MRQKTERKQHQFGIPMPIWDKLEDIKDHLGVASMNDAFQYCVIQTYKKEIDNYMVAIKTRGARPTSMDPVERAQAKVIGAEAEKEAKKKIIHEQGLKLCALLDGQVIETNGLFSCAFDTYEVVNPNYAIKGALTVPFEQLNENHVVNQVRPVGTKKEEAITIYNNME